MNRELVKKTLDTVTLYDIMAEDNYVWVKKNDGYGYSIEIEDQYHIEPYLKEPSVSPEAMESMAHFCRRFLDMYNQLEEK